MVEDLEKRRPPIECRINGVKLESRHNNPHEIELMMRVVMVLSPVLSENIVSIWCDSNACHWFTVTLSRCDGIFALRRMSRLLSAAFIAAGGGYNGLYVACGDRSVSFDADWDEDWDEE